TNSCALTTSSWCCSGRPERPSRSHPTKPKRSVGTRAMRAIRRRLTTTGSEPTTYSAAAWRQTVPFLFVAMRRRLERGAGGLARADWSILPEKGREALFEVGGVKHPERRDRGRAEPPVDIVARRLGALRELRKVVD